MENALQRSLKISKLTCGICSNVGSEDGDRLSNLPEPIVHHIFSFLETIDVVRASAVSRKWSLKCLTLERIEFGGDELDNYKLKIARSNLDSFNIFAPLLPDFTLEGLNSLQNAFIFLETIGEYMEAKEICHRMSKILNGLRDVKVLKLSCTLYQDEYYDDWEIPDKVILCLTCHLKTVELIDFSSNENVLELVRFLLKNGRVLQKLRVSWLKGVENCRGIVSTIMKFTISSSSVALKFLDPKPFLDFFNTF